MFSEFHSVSDETRKDSNRFHDCVPAVVAQSVKRPELRSLKKVQLRRHEFDSGSRHRISGRKILAMPSVEVLGAT